MVLLIRRRALTGALLCTLGFAATLLMWPLGSAGRPVQAEQGPGTSAGGGDGGPASTVIWRVATSQPDVAITFDDGPDPTNTPQVLALLRAHGAVATFFVLGRQAERYPALVHGEAAEGSEVCNHGYSHAALVGRSAAFVRADVAQAAEVLQRLGVGRCRLFRFPYFASDATARAVVASLGYRLVAASVDPQDWRGGSGQRIVRWVFRHVRPGDIILLHDGGGPRGATLAALAPILQGLEERGLRPVTVSQLLSAGLSSTR
jgi:peptidoglycan/xylan/chitin deacetylase (PgdA/CDA1 family)